MLPREFIVASKAQPLFPSQLHFCCRQFLHWWQRLSWRRRKERRQWRFSWRKWRRRWIGRRGPHRWGRHHWFLSCNRTL